jgi:endonuclease/exonuclease/phosphatase family metal-dependent hydrolase
MSHRALGTSVSNDRRINNLGYKNRLILGTWNVKSGITNNNNLTSIIGSARSRNVDILGVQETGKSGSGVIEAPLEYTLLWSGQPGLPPGTRTRARGVALLLSPRANESLINSKPVSDRILLAQFAIANRITLNIIVFYAPHSHSSSHERREFYTNLRHTIHSIHPREPLFLLGDANAMVGSATSPALSFNRALGRHGVNSLNDAGRQLLEFCADEDLFISNTFFQHRAARKNTYVPTLPHLIDPHSTTPNCINNDYIIGRRSFFSSVTNVRVYRSMNGLAERLSDHYPVLAFIKLKFRRQTTGILATGKPDFSSLALDEDTRTAYATRLDALLEENEDQLDASNTLQDRWDTLTKIARTAENVLPTTSYNPHRHPPPSPNLLALLQQSARIRQRMGFGQHGRGILTRSIRGQLKQVKKDIRAELKIMHTQDQQFIAQNIDNAFQSGHQASAWQLIKELSPNRFKADCPALHSGDGTLVHNTQEQLRLLRNHFVALYDDTHIAPVDISGLTLSNVNTSTAAQPLTSAEVNMVLSSLKNKKAAAPNGLRNEHLRYASPLFKQQLFQVVDGAWNQGLPASCRCFDLVTIPKPGDATDVRNRRSISLSDKLYHVVSKTLANRLTIDNEERLHEEQAGFRPHRGCQDQRCTLQLVMDEARRCKKDVFLVLVDFKKAFDNVDRNVLSAIMAQQDVEEDYLRVAKDLHTDTTVRIRWQHQRSAPFPVKRGVQQGSPASNPEWNCFIDHIVRETLQTSQPDIGLRIHYNTESPTLDRAKNTPADFFHLNMLLFADDVLLLADDTHQLQTLLNTLHRTAARWGLEVNEQKTKAMVLHGSTRSDSTPPPSLTLNSQPLEYIPATKYLGTWLSTNCSIDHAVTKNLAKAQGAFQSLSHIWTNRHFDLRTKLHVFNLTVMTILLYGAESWPVTTSVEQRLAVFHHKHLRKILHQRPRQVNGEWRYPCSTKELLRMANSLPMENILRCRRLQWLGHVIRMDSSRFTKRLLTGQLHHPCRRRRVQTLRTVYAEDIRKLRGTINGLSWKEMAMDRNAWRRLIEGYRQRILQHDDEPNPVAQPIDTSLPPPVSSTMDRRHSIRIRDRTLLTRTTPINHTSTRCPHGNTGRLLGRSFPNSGRGRPPSRGCRGRGRGRHRHGQGDSSSSPDSSSQQDQHNMLPSGPVRSSTRIQSRMFLQNTTSDRRRTTSPVNSSVRRSLRIQQRRQRSSAHD